MTPSDRSRPGLGLGAAFIAASALCFGSMAIFARAAYASGVDPATLLLLRFTLAAGLTWGLFLLRGASLPRGRTLYTLLAMGAVGYAGQAFCYFGALTVASAGLVALLLYLYPALVAILSRVVLGHPMTPLHAAAVAVALLGSALTIGDAGDGSALGILLGLLGSFIYAVYILTGSRLPRDLAPEASTAVILSSAAAVYALVAAVRGVRLPATAAGWGAVAAIAVVCTVMAVGLFLAGLTRVGPVRASIYSTVEPVFTVALAALFLGEAITWPRVLGGGLILLAVVMLARADLRLASGYRTSS
jgi:drug/metabolite transporter (DMT)-like permease